MSTFAQVLSDHERQHPDRVALTLQHSGQPDRPLTYRQLLQGAAACAAQLEEAGIRPGEVVVLILQHGIDLVYAYFGAILHGAIPSVMPFLTEKLLPERYRAELASLVSITQPAAICTYGEFADEVRAALRPDDSVRAVLLPERAGPGRAPDYARLGGLQRAPEDIVLLQHSSGTTGLQKGVALSHQAVFNQLAHYSQALHLDENDVIVSWLPLYHDMGLIAGFLMPLLRGVPLVLMSPFDWVRAPYRLLQAVSQYRGTLSWMPNFAFNFCAQKIRDRHLEGVDLSSWRAVINCSEPVRHASHVAFLERFRPYGLRPGALATCYAMAENVFAVTQGGIEAPLQVDEIDREAFQVERQARPAAPGRPALNMLSNGRPVSGVAVRVLDPQGDDLPDRRVGEIAIRSDCMLSEYYHRPDVTAGSFRDGWFLTGDFGYRAEGELYVSGRKKDLIIVGGKNVYPQDLEELAMLTPGVHPGRVSAFGVFDEAAGTEDVVIVAEVDSPDAGEREQIVAGIRQNVTRGSAVALRQVYLVGPHWLVKTSSGKNARLANRDKYLAETLGGE
ncbi:MAG: fatty acyl-AMP ligase [Chloroflexi bacterium]|nr:AMP-binding protein [Anaerolineaceae bacterium]NMB89045.1 fatty acyl-AMP ligase [Chloroflexota bacterium]